MVKEIAIGIIAAVGASAITWVATESREKLTDLEMKTISKNIVNENEFRELLLREFKEDGSFKGKDGSNGRNGIDGKPGISKPKTNGNNWCSDFSDGYQICWGHQIVNGSEHYRNFDFSYVSPFSAPPMVTNGINAVSEGYLFSVYNHTVTTTKYYGNIAENNGFRKSTTPVTMNYVAIGRK